MCALITLSSCTKKPHTPTEDPQPAEVGFTAASQAVWVKGGDDTTTQSKFSDIHDNFGVWGIARQEGSQLPYVLWGTNSLTLVEESSEPGIYTPQTAAYWIKDYNYNFLAVAPLTDAGLAFTGITTKEDQLTATPPVENPSDYMTFTYDMSTKYTGIPATETTQAVAPDYTFDLLGAAAEQSVNTGGYNEPQQLFFWHLLSKLSIKVIFVDANGTEVTSNNNAVTNLSISNVNPKGNFTLKYIKTAGSTGNLSVVPVADSQAQSKTIDFDASSAKDENGRWNAHIIPQTISNFVIDIAYNVTGSDGNVTYYNDSISLANSTPATYDPNGQYNWTIKINPKGQIGFHVQIADWNEPEDGMNDFEIL